MKLNSLTIEEALEGLRDRKFSALELTRACLEQIHRNNNTLNAFVTVCEAQALAQATKIDRMKRNNPRRPLQGIPIAVKDNLLTKNIRTTAASQVLDNYIPQYESTVTRRLREAGAIIIGKTNMDAWAHGSSTETSDFGATRNPWNTQFLPGGSSGGSAAAVAADCCIAAIGTETAGSIRQPAAWCGVCGLKPTYGRVSRYGVIAMASSTDSPGPLTKTVKDAGIVFAVIAGRDMYDATTIQERADFAIERLAQDQPAKTLRVGLIKDYLLEEAQAGINQKVLEAVALLQKEDIEVTEVSLLDPHYAIADYTIIQRAEVSSNLARYDGIRYGNGRSLFGDEAKRRIMFGTYTLSAGYYDQYYAKAQQVRAKIIADFNRVFATVDLLIAPTSPSTALPVGSTAGEAMFGELQDILVEASSMAGLPGVSVPCGFVQEMPVGMQIIGQIGDERTVLQLAYRYQQLTGWHKQRPKMD